MDNFYNLLINTLKKEQSYINDNAELKKWVVKNASQNYDPRLIELLLSEEELKKNFFMEIKDHLVFNQKLFNNYIENKNYFNDSYTRFKNKIGLNIDGKYLHQRNEVSLVWPFKDCVLEGGQTKEEQKREEIFFNEILAQDEIDQLFEPKVLTNWKRYTVDGEQEVKEIKRENGVIKENLIIKGNNLLALHSLKKQFEGKIKLIYIDPPYNTGNDSFSYNDNFNHSSWLTFMKNRLELSRELLKDDGVIFVQCDDNEQAYLKVLMDEIFGRENFIEVITVVNNPRGRDYGGVANMHEFMNVFAKSINYNLYPLEDKDKTFPYQDTISGFEIRELRNRNTKFNDKNRPNLLYPFYLDPKKQNGNGFFEIFLEKADGLIEVWPTKSQMVQTVWRWGKEKSAKNLNINICGKAMKEDRRYQIVEKYRKKTRMARSVWWDKEVNSERGTLHLKELFKKKIFDNPKPEETLKRIIEMSTREGDIVLDFHLGSGTTASVAHKMRRQYIGIEQMNYIETVACERLKKVVGKKTKNEDEMFESIEFDATGISSNVNWKGGGDFIYIELKKYNEEFIKKIELAKSTDDLLKIWEEMKEYSFFNYNVDIKKQDEMIDDFKQLPIKEQKQHLFQILNKNQLYVNLSSIDDEDFKVDEKEKKLTKEFYGDNK